MKGKKRASGLSSSRPHGSVLQALKVALRIAKSEGLQGSHIIETQEENQPALTSAWAQQQIRACLKHPKR